MVVQQAAKPVQVHGSGHTPGGTTLGKRKSVPTNTADVGVSQPAAVPPALGGGQGIPGAATQIAKTSSTNSIAVTTPRITGIAPQGTPTPAKSGNATVTSANPAMGASIATPPVTTASMALSTEEARLQSGGEPDVPRAARRRRLDSPEPSKIERLERILTESLLEDVAGSVRIHLFSAISSSSGRIMKPRVLRMNKAVLAKSSRYFADRLNSNTASDPSWIIFNNYRVVRSSAGEKYEYESDSDLDDCDDSSVEEHQSTSGRFPSRDDTRLSESGAGFGFGGFGQTVAPPRGDGNNAGLSFGTVVQKPLDSSGPVNAKFSGGRHMTQILVKDTAFQTWYTFLNYLYTEKVPFLPLSSARLGPHHESSTFSPNEPGCSAKSMYRLASKVGLNPLREKALVHIRSQLTERNILKELSCSLLARYPELLAMELDVLHRLVTSPTVVANFPAFARRIANKELPHGANIIIGLHTRLLKQLHSSPAALQHNLSSSASTSQGIGSATNISRNTSSSQVSAGEEIKKTDGSA